VYACALTRTSAVFSKIDIFLQYRTMRNGKQNFEEILRSPIPITVSRGERQGCCRESSRFLHCTLSFKRYSFRDGCHELLMSVLLNNRRGYGTVKLIV
ncbi:MAG: hypothetical protein ACFNQG_06985, partial [Treponema socranskii subsp. buccale]